MNFTFSFVDDPDNEQLYGNITWKIPDTSRPSHWIHSESICKRVYNVHNLIPKSCRIPTDDLVFCTIRIPIIIFLSTDEGVYNTYVLDFNAEADKSWLLLLHCAEKQGSARYLSSFILSRRTKLPPNVISFLRDKLPQYDVDLQYLFKMRQSDCATRELPAFLQAIKSMIKTSSRNNQHPMKHAQH